MYRNTPGLSGSHNLGTHISLSSSSAREAGCFPIPIPRYKQQTAMFQMDSSRSAVDNMILCMYCSSTQEVWGQHQGSAPFAFPVTGIKSEASRQSINRYVYTCADHEAAAAAAFLRVGCKEHGGNGGS